MRTPGICRSSTPTFPRPYREPTATATPTVIPRGDVNGDSTIDALDLVALIAALFLPDPPAAANVNGDLVNGDPLISAADVTELLMILGGE